MSRVSVFTLIERSINNMGAINPKVKDLAVELVIRSYHLGIYVQITSGLRTYAQQTKLYNQGRTTSGNIVTNAKAGQSIHNFGLAIDYVLVSEDGDTAYWDINRNMNGNQVRDWFEVAAIGKQLGFAWGGDWKSFKDYPHLDMQKGYSLATLRSGSRPSIPGVPKRLYQGVGDSGSDVMKTQQNLTKAGYKCSADGYYGEDTEEVVKKFQRANGLTDDGFYGKSSESKLTAILANLNKPKPVTPKPVVKPAAPSKPVVKIEEDEIMDLKQWQKEELRDIYKDARIDKKIISSDEHEKAVMDGTLTVSDAVYLHGVLAGAALNNDKRLKQQQNKN